MQKESSSNRGKEFKKIDEIDMLEWANKYIDHCLESTKEIATASGVKTIRERHLPTISYFLLIWLPRQGQSLYKRTAWYNAINDSNHPNHNIVKEIDNMFRALAADVVANEGKGIFYAKNLLGWTDRQQTDGKQEIVVTYEGKDTNQTSEGA